MPKEAAAAAAVVVVVMVVVALPSTRQLRTHLLSQSVTACGFALALISVDACGVIASAGW